MYNNLTTSVHGFLKVSEPRPGLGQRLCTKTPKSQREKGVKYRKQSVNESYILKIQGNEHKDTRCKVSMHLMPHPVQLRDPKPGRNTQVDKSCSIPALVYRRFSQQCCLRFGSSGI
jgi:hypothetical protein